ncbi:TetR/AcrR family transcriptional regulator [Halomonas sp. CUBES01]|uniref:TetR/AcrR family transcriptional regulator n=1 Tax=Halomonas sp. CUBES01 TaxID=2897340 RepID=UPI001E604A4A|nr:TetR/AcrR family transcriptional regulator [Halomonas sp. CUBES01]MEC4766351.1 TetR/AcrR family transcriptional regulator [Halomonas sp. CUBES01]
MKKRDDILYTALRLFNENGYHAVGVDRIRDEAHVSKMTLYKHFANKDKLVEEVLKLRHVTFKESLENEISKAEDPLDKINAFINWHIRWFFSNDFHGCMFIKATGEFHDTANFLSVSQDHKEWLTNLLEDLLKAANVSQPESCAQLFEITLDGMIVNVSIFQSFERIQAAWYKLCDAVNLPRLTLEKPM